MFSLLRDVNKYICIAYIKHYLYNCAHICIWVQWVWARWGTYLVPTHSLSVFLYLSPISLLLLVCRNRQFIFILIQVLFSISHITRINRQYPHMQCACNIIINCDFAAANMKKIKWNNTLLCESKIVLQYYYYEQTKKKKKKQEEK